MVGKLSVVGKVYTHMVRKYPDMFGKLSLVGKVYDMVGKLSMVGKVYRHGR